MDKPLVNINDELDPEYDFDAAMTRSTTKESNPDNSETAKKIAISAAAKQNKHSRAMASEAKASANTSKPAPDDTMSLDDYYDENAGSIIGTSVEVSKSNISQTQTNLNGHNSQKVDKNRVSIDSTIKSFDQTNPNAFEFATVQQENKKAVRTSVNANGNTNALGFEPLSRDQREFIENWQNITHSYMKPISRNDITPGDSNSLAGGNSTYYGQLENWGIKGLYNKQKTVQMDGGLPVLKTEIKILGGAKRKSATYAVDSENPDPKNAKLIQTEKTNLRNTKTTNYDKDGHVTKLVVASRLGGSIKIYKNGQQGLKKISQVLGSYTMNEHVDDMGNKIKTRKLGNKFERTTVHQDSGTKKTISRKIGSYSMKLQVDDMGNIMKTRKLGDKFERITERQNNGTKKTISRKIGPYSMKKQVDDMGNSKTTRKIGGLYNSTKTYTPDGKLVSKSVSALGFRSMKTSAEKSKNIIAGVVDYAYSSQQSKPVNIVSNVSSTLSPSELSKDSKATQKDMMKTGDSTTESSNEKNQRSRERGRIESHGI